MKAIIISNTDACALLDQLELVALRRDNIIRDDRPATVDQMHRAFHYVVTRWLQAQGADVVGR